MVMPKNIILDEAGVVQDIDSELMVTDPDSGTQIPIKLLLGKKRIKIENSLLYSVMLFGTLTDEQINEFVKLNEGKLTQNDKISHYLYQQAGQHNKDAINALLELNLAIAKRDKTTIVNFTPTQETESISDSIIDKLEKELAEITEGEVTEPLKLDDKKIEAKTFSKDEIIDIVEDIKETDIDTD